MAAGPVGSHGAPGAHPYQARPPRARKWPPSPARTASRRILSGAMRGYSGAMRGYSRYRARARFLWDPTTPDVARLFGQPAQPKYDGGSAAPALGAAPNSVCISSD